MQYYKQDHNNDINNNNKNKKALAPKYIFKLILPINKPKMKSYKNKNHNLNSTTTTKYPQNNWVVTPSKLAYSLH